MMMSSVNHDDFAHLKIPLEYILSATNNFADENFRGVGGFGNHYQGQLMWSGELIDILAHRWNKEWDEKEQQFWMEISLLSTLKHKNLVSLVGFCDENGEKIIIIKLETMFSLENYVSDTIMLTWMRRLEICVGIAHALSYIHYDEHRNFSIIHRNIDCKTLQLNNNFEPKLSEFRLSMKIEASQRHRSFRVDKVQDMEGYTDPTYIETKTVSHKSDIYSFGIVMFELLCGRKEVINDNQDNKYLAPMAILHYREEKLEDLVERDLWKQIDPQSFKVFTKIAYNCLNQERSQRPDIKEIVMKLEEALKLACENKHVSLLSSLKHKNVVSLVGFCDENDEKIIIIRRETRGMLFQYLSDPMLLTWVRRLEISVGLAHALSYIHYNEPRDFSVIHQSIDSSRVLLSDEWEPKLCDFENSMKIKASQRHHSFHTNTVKGANGFIDPTYLQTKRVSHKSDMYSFGIVLLELLCARTSIIESDTNKYLAPLAATHYREKRLNEIIDWDLWNQMDTQSFNIFAETSYDCLNEEQSQRPNIDEIVTRLERAWELQKPILSLPSNEFAHLKVPLESIISATNNFHEKDGIKSSVFSKNYKGRLLWSGELINITAKRYNKEESYDREQLFWTDISMFSSLKHKNVVSLVGFCDENDEKIIITKRETRGMLRTYLSDSMALTWVRRLEISVGIAHALSYIHYDESRDFSVIHRLISSNKVVLNDQWEPKLCCDFEVSMKIKVSQRHHSFYNIERYGCYGYVDPTYTKTHIVSQKSDIYSFGIVMFELLCGRRSIINTDTEANNYLAQLAITHYREKRLNEIIDWDLWKQMDSQTFNIFAEIAFNCLNEEQPRRPNIHDIVSRLEKALESARENRPIHSVPNDLAHLRISLEYIESATNYFDKENAIGEEGGFGKRYKGKLLWSGELIDITARRLSNEEWDEKEQQFWLEISMLSSLKHKNVVSIIGFCNEVGAETIIYKHGSTKRLDNNLSNATLLTWVGRLKISVGVARAISYIHYDESREFSVIHQNIGSETILLINGWEPMLSGFAHSKKINASDRHHSFHTDLVWSRKGYTDPTCLETRSVNHKSDMYSFGIVLFELLCGRKSINHNHDNKYLAPVAMFHYRENILDDMINPDLLKHMDPESFNVFAKTAYDSLNEESSRRPDIVEVMTRLEEALKLQLAHENRPEHSIVATKVEGTSSNRDKESMTIISTNVESHVSKKTMSSVKDLSNLKLSFQDIASATHNFAHENIIKEFRHGTIFKGRLQHSQQFIDIAAKKFFSSDIKRESKKIWTEIFMLSSLNHKNLASIIGFCDEERVKIIIYKRVNKSLQSYLSDKTLKWMQRLKICIGIEKALSYIHYDDGRDFSVIHCNIRSSKILLDDKWEPKLSGFEFSLKNTVPRRHRLLLTRDIVKNLYMDPRYEKTGGVTHKSDVYSFGVVLLEVLCGRSAILPDEKLGEGLLNQLAKSHLDDMIDPHLRKQMDPESFKIFSETTFYCIQEERVKRPHIDHVVKRLEKALEHQWKCENPVDRTSSDQLKGKNLEHLKIGLNDIKEATNNFDNAYIIGSGGFGKVYKANLEHFDRSNPSSIEGVNYCDIPKKRSTVAIKRINNQEGEQGFIAEIETLTCCKHENIISLLGFCYEGNGAMILVYEHASKGSLENYLGNSDKMTTLTWVQRLYICLDIAHGLNYIHNNTEHGKQKMIHRDVKSDNILLGDNWKAKIADFGLSKFHPLDQLASTFYTSMIAGTNVYLDPEYQKYGKLSKKSDIYSFGVVLLEILAGRLAYDSVYINVNEKGIAPISRDHFEKGTIMEIVDHKIKEETDEHVFSLSKGPNKESLDSFLKIAFRCVAETQAQRPTIEVVIKELKKALNCQENHKDNLKLSLKDIQLATQNLCEDNIIGKGDFGNVYRGEFTHAHVHSIIAAKRMAKKSVAKDAEFMTELEILMEYKHENVIGLVGYCDEEDEKIIVYDYASGGSLDNYLSDDSLTWVVRLKICIDIAIGLEFLHGTVSSPEMVIHRDIKSSNILLFDDQKAKITGFGLSLVCPTNQNADYVIDNVTGTRGYRDPLHSETGFLTKESDIFSLGAVLFDVLCGKLSSEKLDDEYLYLPFLAKYHYHVGKLDKLVFEGIKEQIVPESYITFTRIALQCLHHRRERRPTAQEVVIQLKKSLEFQEDHEIWEPTLAKDYKEIIQMSKCPEDYSTIMKEDLYNIFSKGILLQQEKAFLSFDGMGERNAMFSATTFSYKKSCPHEWKSLPESRFESVAEMSDVSNLNVEIESDTQLLSPNVVYAVNLVFKLCDSRKVSIKPMYVNLKYRVGFENLHAYFAKQRDEDWLMIELYQFIYQKEDVMFTVLLESFSSYYCGDGAIYVEGIEFRAIDKVKHEEIEKLKEVQQVLESNFNVDHVQHLPTNFEEIFEIHRNYDELFWLGEINGKKLLAVSAKEALYKFSNVDLFTSKPSSQSRFPKVIALLPQQVFYINCTIRSQMLSPETKYVCHLVFKLSEECQGLHNPVKVRDLLHQVNEEAEFFYFITPSPLNINDIVRVPKQREDGWMEIQLWKFNSTRDFKDDSLSIYIKFTSHEGPMSGLIISGLEFRPTFIGNSDDIQRQRDKKEMLQDEAQNPHIQPIQDEKATELSNR